MTRQCRLQYLHYKNWKASDRILCAQIAYKQAHTKLQQTIYTVIIMSSCDHVYDQIPPLIYYSTDGLTVRGTFGPTMCITRHIHWNILGYTSTAQFAHSKYNLSLFVQTTEHSHIFLTSSKMNSNTIATYIPPIHWTTLF